jgi:hypothetical protein
VKEPNLALMAGQGVLGAVSSYARGDMGGVMKSVSSLVKTAGGRGAEQRARQMNTSPADVVSMLLFSSFQGSPNIYRYRGAGAKTRRQVRMPSRPGAPPVP